MRRGPGAAAAALVVWLLACAAPVPGPAARPVPPSCGGRWAPALRLRGGSGSGPVADPAGSADFTVELQKLAQSPALSRGRLGRLSLKRLVQLFRLRCPDDACAQKPDKDALIET
jgi:hypothetical protein